MEDDALKKYINTNRSAFETEELPKGLLNKIQQDMNRRKEQKKKRSELMRYFAAASVILITLVVGLIFIKQPVDTSFNEVVKEEAKTQQETKQETKPKIQAIDSINVNDQSQKVMLVERKHQKNKEDIQSEITVSKKEENLVYTKQYAQDETQVKTELNPNLYRDLNDQTSSSNRLAAVLEIKGIGLTEESKKALCKTFLEDKNENVRLAALDILSPYSDEPMVMSVFEAALTDFHDPFVQVELAKVLGTSDNPKVQEQLYKLLWDDNVIEPVRKEVLIAMSAKHYYTN